MKTTALVATILWAGLMASCVRAYDRAAYPRLLKEHTRDGRVNYAALKEKDFRTLATLYRSLADAPAKPDLAFWINAYNIIVLREVTAAHPVKDVWSVDKNFFKKKHFVAGKQLSLDDIEKEVIGKQFRDARAHFGVNCASASCPILPPEPFTSENVDAQLDEGARGFINGEANVTFDEASGALLLSKIFDWYAADFERSAGSVEKFLAKYLSPEKQRLLQTRQWDIKYLPYDWSLNELKP